MNESQDFELIFAYTTKEAIADGFLVQIPEDAAREAGIRFPVIVTREVWDKYIEVPAEFDGIDDLSGRLFDLLYMFSLKARNCSLPQMSFRFYCKVPAESIWEEHESNGSDSITRGIRLKSVIQAMDIDDPSPAIFIMKPNQD